MGNDKVNGPHNENRLQGHIIYCENTLKLNDNKTEVMIVSSSRTYDKTEVVTIYSSWTSLPFLFHNMLL